MTTVARPSLQAVDMKTIDAQSTFTPVKGFFRKSYSFYSDNILTINALITNLFECYSKVVPVRVDFYLKEEFAHQFNHQQFHKWFTRLRNNMRNNSLFDELITYACRLEYAKKTGWHYHAIFFYNGQIVQDDIYHANETCRYWETVITKGMGRAYSSNLARIQRPEQEQQAWAVDDESKRYSLGGYIAYTDQERIYKLRQSCYYLAKITDDDSEAVGQIQYPVRLFNTGKIPLKNADLWYKRGRPRKHLIPSNPERERQLEALRKAGKVPYFKPNGRIE